MLKISGIGGAKYPCPGAGATGGRGDTVGRAICLRSSALGQSAFVGGVSKR
jgi:hypothetical protein